MPAAAPGASPLRVEAWQVRDSGLAAVPGPFRRLPGALRHHRGRGDPWPEQVVLELDDDELVVPGVGRWPRADVSIRRQSEGPPVTFVVQLPTAAYLLAAPATVATQSLLAAFSA